MKQIESDPRQSLIAKLRKNQPASTSHLRWESPLRNGSMRLKTQVQQTKKAESQEGRKYPTPKVLAKDRLFLTRKIVAPEVSYLGSQSQRNTNKTSILDLFKGGNTPVDKNQAKRFTSPQISKRFSAALLNSAALKQLNPYFLPNVKRVFMPPLQDDYFSRLWREHFQHIYLGINSHEFLIPQNQSDFSRPPIMLTQKPGYEDKITLVLDLDETLIHCTDSATAHADVIMTFNSSQGQVKAGINIRPGAQQFLEELSRNFEIIVFTASHAYYADRILDYLDPKGEFVHHRLYRHHCVVTQYSFFIKDLKILNRPLSRVVLVDNASYSFVWQLDNGIPILPFYANQQDRELDSLKAYLMGLIDAKDVRQYNREHLKMFQFYDPNGHACVYHKLFRQQMGV